MVPVELGKPLVAVFGAQAVHGVGVVEVREEGLPERFFHAFGVLACDEDAVLVGSFHRLLLGGKPVQVAIPKIRGQDEREIAIAMRGGSLQRGQQFQQQRRAGPCQAGNEHRPPDLDRGEVLGQQTCLPAGQVAQQRLALLAEANQEVVR